MQIFTNADGLPMDDAASSRCTPSWSKWTSRCWVHPTRMADVPDYLTEHQSKFGIYCIFGSPHETAVFMTRADKH